MTAPHRGSITSAGRPVAVVVVLLAALVLLVGFNCRRGEPRGLPDHEGSVRRGEPMPDIVFVPEMEPFGAEFTSAAPAVSPDALAAFQAKWARFVPTLATRVTPDALAGISRWAVAETRTHALPPDWAGKLSLIADRGTADARGAWFSHAVKSGPALPTHSPVVHRHLVLAAAVEVSTGRITTVYVTIRGWAEE